MARETTKWHSTRWPITKIMSSDGCNGNRVPLEMGPWSQYTTRSCWLWPGHLDWWFSGDEETNQLNGLTPVDRIDELSPYPLETVSEDGFCHPFVGFEADRLGLVEPIADFVRPAEGDGKDGGELGDALRVGHVGVFEVEALPIRLSPTPTICSVHPFS